MKARLLNVLLLFALAVGLLTPTHTVRAATTWEVRSTGDGAPTPANCPGANCRLRDAIAAAAPGDTIQFHLPIPSTITLTNGELNLDESLTLSGTGSTQLTIDGNNASRIFYIANQTTVSITGMKLTNGLTIDYSGGAIYNQDGTVFLDDLIVTQNTVISGFSHGGGGIFNFGALTITNSQITNNSALYGGGIYSSYGSALNMTNVTVSGNQATAIIGSGGGITLSSQPDFPSSMNLDGVVVSGNTSTGSAGGVEINSDAVVSIKNSSISGNIAQSGSGGGLVIQPNANVTVENSTINGNQSTEDGGGIWLSAAALALTDSTISLNIAGNTSNDEGGGIMSFGASTLSLNRVIIYNNSAGKGGGLSSYGAATLTNVTLSGNLASVQAGGIDNSGTMDLNHVTLADNSAVNHTGGIATYAGSATNVRNSIFADSTAPGSADCTGSINSQGHNLIENDNPLNCFISGDTGTNIIGQDPMLDTLSDNGGSTLTMNLLASSPAIDSADSATCALEDQRNFLRGQDGNGDDVNECDMGAVEYAPYPVPYSITRTDSNPTSAAQVNYTVKFSEPVGNVDIGDFDVVNITGNITGASLNGVTGSGLEYTVTVNTGSGNGTLQLELLDDDSILSSFSGDPLDGTGAGNGGALGEAYILDKTAPAVEYITRNGVNPTSAAQVSFEVMFSEEVTGVNAPDFTLTTTGITGASVVNVSGTGYTYSVTVNTGSGNGTIRLNVADDDSIVDNVNLNLGGAGAGNGNYTSGQIYTIDKGSPPTDISLSASSLTENLPAGTTVGNFASTDPDSGDTFTYSLVSGAGSTDNTAFSISGNTLFTTQPFNFLNKNSYSIRVRSTDNGGLFFEKAFTISILNAPPIFADVPDSYWAVSFIERLFNAGITGGCTASPLNYCPENTVTRAQMAVFLLKGIHGSSYVPPAVGASTGFNDVATDYWAAAWIKQLAAESITGGCGGGAYCPDNAVNRAQMAVFLLKAKYGTSYSPPDIGSGSGFTDVAADYWAAAWIKQLAAEGITSGCAAGLYCPETAVTRAQMAVFLVKAFNLP